MRVVLLTEKYFDRYEKFLHSQQGAMIYYSLKFRDFLKLITSGEPEYYIVVDSEGEVTGVLPLFNKTGKYGKVLNSLPYYGSNGGILSSDEESKRLLLNKYLEILDSGDVAASTLISNPLDLNYDYNLVQTTDSDFRIGQFTDLSGRISSLEDLLLRFHSKTRNIIRKAIKSEVKVSIENDMFGFLQETHFENMETIGGLAKSQTFFNLIPKIFEESKGYNIYVARFEGIPVAAVLLLYYGKVVEYYTPVIVKEFRHLQALSYLIAQSMLDANTKGFSLWNWGGTWQSQGGVYDFKSKWGTDDREYTYYISVFNKELYGASKAELLKEYSGFYVLPFSMLKS